MMEKKNLKVKHAAKINQIKIVDSKHQYYPISNDSNVYSKLRTINTYFLIRDKRNPITQ